jgi:hypothetical protein
MSDPSVKRPWDDEPPPPRRFGIGCLVAMIVSAIGVVVAAVFLIRAIAAAVSH